MSSVTIRLFAILKDLAGEKEFTTSLPDDNPTIEHVRAAVIQQFPTLKPALPSAIAAVNREYVFADHPIADGDEIAFFPPVSGGNDYPEHFALVEGPIDLNDLTARIVTPATGAVVLFNGFVRGETNKNGDTRHTTRLEYEAYEPMAIEKMQQVAAEIREKWSLIQGIAIVQSIGVLEVSQPTVLIACASGHRDQGCFEAARYGIDRLKEIVPVWKKEIGKNGEQWIEGGYHPTETDRTNG